MDVADFLRCCRCIVAAEVQSLHSSIVVPIPKARGFLKPKHAIEIMLRDHIFTPSATVVKILNDFCVSLDMDADLASGLYEESVIIGFELQCYADRLGINDGIYSRGLFEDDLAYESWIKCEEDEVGRLLAKFSEKKANRVLVLHIEQATDLIAKDANGTCNAYAVVTIAETEYRTKCVSNSTSPTWKHEIAIPVSTGTSEFTVSVWNSNAKLNTTDNDAFLGMCTVDACSETRKSWIDLEKRTKRSNIGSGKIELSCREASKYHKFGSRVIPEDPITTYSVLIAFLVTKYYSGGCLGIFFKSKCGAFTNTIRSCWRIAPLLHHTIIFENLLDTFRKPRSTLTMQDLIEFGVGPLLTQLSDSSSCIVETERLDDAFCRFKESIFKRIFECLELILDKEDRNDRAEFKLLLKFFDFHEEYMEWKGASEDLVTRLQSTIQRFIEERFSRLMATPGDTQIFMLIKTATNDIQITQTFYDDLILNAVHIPTLITKFYYMHTLLKLQEFGDDYANTKLSLQDCFEIYHAAREFKIVIELVDFKLSDGMLIETWFKPMLEDWVAFSVQKFVAWTQNAIKMDTIDSELGQTHSTSAIDLFTFIRQQLDYLAGLHWPNSAQESSIRFILLESIAGIVDSYTREMIHLTKSELHTVQKPSEKVLKLPLGKKRIKVKIPQIKSKIKLNPTELKVSGAACVRLNNLRFISKNIAKLVSHIECTKQRAKDDTLVPVCIRFTDLLDFQIIRPYSLKVYLRLISSTTGQEYGKTNTFYQKRTLSLADTMPEFAQTIYANLTKRDIEYGVDVLVVQAIPGKIDVTLSKSVIKVPNADGVFDVHFQGGGRIRCGVVYKGCSSETTKEVIGYRLGSDIDRYMTLIAEQDSRKRIKTILKKHKTTKMTEIFSLLKTKTSQNDSFTSDDVEGDMDELYQFLNSNLEILNSYLDAESCGEIIGRIWVMICGDVEVLLLGEWEEEMFSIDAKNRIAWEEKRIAFTKHVVELLASFFYADGEGLQRDQVYCERFDRVRLIGELYFKPVLDLKNEFQRPVGTLYTIANFERYGWILRLLRVRGEKDYSDIHFSKFFMY